VDTSCLSELGTASFLQTILFPAELPGLTVADD